MYLTENAGIIWPSSCFPVGTEAQRTGVNADTLVIAIVVSNNWPLSLIHESHSATIHKTG